MIFGGIIELVNKLMSFFYTKILEENKMDIILDTLARLLNNIFGFFGDWGISIIVLTVIVKLILLPLSIKQKQSISKQQELTKKINYIKIKYKNQKNKIEEELAKLTKENSKHMLGCFVGLSQMPILYSLYKLFNTTHMGAETFLVPWVSSIKLPDPYYVIPFLVIIMQLLPNIISSFKIINDKYIPKLSVHQVVITTLLGLIITIKLPIAIGIYWITSSFISTFETIVFSLFNNKNYVKDN
jgi:YidC/Oxa1 family membrane protein insertase